jgi:SAM-dependent methyltransferase
VSIRLKPRTQAVVHGALLVAACVVLPIIPSDSWKPTGDEEPVTRIVLLLCATVGLPFFVLSSTGPLLQRWFSRISAGSSVYRLYALSNAGSLLALLSYPVGFEWLLGTSTTARLWSWSFVAFAVLCGVCGWIVARLAKELRQEPAMDEQAAAGDARGPSPSWATQALWFALGMVPSVLLLATTNAVCQDVASVPFLWILPLSLYLLTFILCFESDRWYSRRFLMPAAAVMLAAECGVLCLGSDAPILVQILVNFLTLFLCSMVCHGELVRRRPHVSHLTSFYLLLAASGAAGGLFVGVIAPHLFADYYELHIGLFACAVLMVVVVATDRESGLLGVRQPLIWMLVVSAPGMYGLLLYVAAEAHGSNASTVAVTRNFYGVLRVYDETNRLRWSGRPARFLQNGQIVHGVEFTDPALASLPTTYYGRKSGVGLALSLPRDKPRRVGLIGLGIGTLAAYARSGDYYRFYEINPKVEELARQYFHFLEHCRGNFEIVHGDGRLELEREPPQSFDVLVVDAFSGDAIPVHLLTVEAFSIYLRHLVPEGIIAVHISNRHFGLYPVAAAIARAHRLSTAYIHDQGSTESGESSSWVLVAQEPRALRSPSIRRATRTAPRGRILWTDDYASLLAVWDTPLSSASWRVDASRMSDPK